MIGVVVAAHDKVAEALLAAATSVLGPIDYMQAITIDPRDDASMIQEKFKARVEAASKDGGVLILTDMFGGTPSNIGLTLHDGQHIELLTGVNLPMVIKAAQIAKSDTTLEKAAQAVKTVGLNAITIASEMLAIPARKAK